MINIDSWTGNYFTAMSVSAGGLNYNDKCWRLDHRSLWLRCIHGYRWSKAASSQKSSTNRAHHGTSRTCRYGFYRLTK